MLLENIFVGASGQQSRESSLTEAGCVTIPGYFLRRCTNWVHPCLVGVSWPCLALKRDNEGTPNRSGSISGDRLLLLGLSIVGAILMQVSSGMRECDC